MAGNKKKPAKRRKKTQDEKGRPTKYKAAYNGQVYKLCLLGATDKEIADFFEVTESTINLWKETYLHFSESIKKGKDKADTEIARSLFERAKGYSHKEDKIFNENGEPLIVTTIKHYPPDSTAIIFWLKNRQPKKWRDKTDIEHSGEIKIPTVGPIPIIITNPEQQTKLNEHIEKDTDSDA